MTLFEENAAILKDFVAQRVELSSPRAVDFSFIFRSKAMAEIFAGQAKQQGFKTEVEEVDDLDLPWDVTVTTVMIPTCQVITDIEEKLGALAVTCEGRADGWGFFGT